MTKDNAEPEQEALNNNPDNQAALNFLDKFHPRRPRLLVAIKPDGGSIAAQTFAHDAIEETLRWLEKYNGRWNIYFLVNTTLTPLNTKASREDIKEVVYLHLDIDPRAGEDLKAEQERIFNMIRKRPAGVPEPTFCVFSGGGYQLYWKLRKPIPINGNVAVAEEAKLYNVKLEKIFGADSCHNIDRIMRLPGTINIPNKLKLQKGRKRTLAKEVE